MSGDRRWPHPGHLAAVVAMVGAALLAPVALASRGAPGQGSAGDGARPPWLDDPEQLERVLDRWAREYVRHIITDEELRIFRSLPTPEQRLAFVERFWQLRDPTPGTPENEYREEHMRRFAFATRVFAAGKPGWATDRGRIYILLGPPNQIQRNPTGRGPMERASETWTYNFVDNPRLPATIDLHFVDFHGTGEYELVSDLDATAPIWTEQFGFLNRSLDAYALRRHVQSLYDERLGVSRPVDPVALGRQFLDFYQVLREVERVPEIHLERLRSLRESVEARVTFTAVPLERSVAYFEAEGGETAVEVTVGISYDHLRAAPAADRRHYSADLYAALRRDGRVVAEQERRLSFSLGPTEWQRLEGKRILQPLLLAAPPGTYELVVAVRDNVSEAIGRWLDEVVVPDLGGDGLRLSSLILASHVERAGGGPQRPFQHGDLRVVPNVAGSYEPGQRLLLYLQAYGLSLDASGVNRVTIRGRIERQGRPFRAIPAQHPYPAPRERMAFSLAVPLAGFAPGAYTAVVEVVDAVTGARASASAPFQVVAPPRPGSPPSR